MSNLCNQSIDTSQATGKKRKRLGIDVLLNSMISFWHQLDSGEPPRTNLHVTTAGLLILLLAICYLRWDASKHVPFQSLHRNLCPLTEYRLASLSGCCITVYSQESCEHLLASVAAAGFLISQNTMVGTSFTHSTSTRASCRRVLP